MELAGTPCRALPGLWFFPHLDILSKLEGVCPPITTHLKSSRIKSEFRLHHFLTVSASGGFIFDCSAWIVAS